MQKSSQAETQEALEHTHTRIGNQKASVWTSYCRPGGSCLLRFPLGGIHPALSPHFKLPIMGRKPHKHKLDGCFWNLRLLTLCSYGYRSPRQDACEAWRGQVDRRWLTVNINLPVTTTRPEAPKRQGHSHPSHPRRCAQGPPQCFLFSVA